MQSVYLAIGLIMSHSKCVYFYNGAQFKKYNLLLNKVMKVPPGCKDLFDEIPKDVLQNNMRKMVQVLINISIICYFV